jgi:hypothetical protein
MNLEKLGKYLMSGGAIAGLADTVAILHEKITIDNLSQTLQRFIQDNNVSEKVLENSLQKLSGIKSVDLNWAKVRQIITTVDPSTRHVTSSTSICDYGNVDVNPLKFAIDYVNGNLHSTLKQLPKGIDFANVRVVFNDGHAVGGDHRLFESVIKEIGGYGIQEKLNTVENMKNNIQTHQNYLNTTLSFLIPIGIMATIGSYYYLHAGGGTKIKRVLGRFYDKHIRTPLAMRRMEGYQSILYGHI